MSKSTEQSSYTGTSFRPALVYAVLLTIGIPWYWPADDTTMIFGMPAWVVSAIVVSVIASIYTAIQFARPWPGEHEDERS